MDLEGNQEDQGEEFVEEVEGELQEDVDEDYTGQRGFATAKKRIVTFRQRTALEHANYILRYCEYVRNIINEYQGVFSESRLKPTYNPAQPSFFNPDILTFPDNSPFITE